MVEFSCTLAWTMPHGITLSSSSWYHSHVSSSLEVPVLEESEVSSTTGLISTFSSSGVTIVLSPILDSFSSVDLLSPPGNTMPPVSHLTDAGYLFWCRDVTEEGEFHVAGRILSRNLGDEI